MKSRNFTLFSITAGVLFWFVMSFTFPSTLKFLYLIGIVLTGIAIYLINNKIIKTNKEIIVDERIERNTKKAAYIVFRITFLLTYIPGLLISVYKSNIQALSIIGYTLLAVGLFLILSFLIIYKTLDIRN